MLTYRKVLQLPHPCKLLSLLMLLLLLLLLLRLLRRVLVCGAVCAATATAAATAAAANQPDAMFGGSAAGLPLRSGAGAGFSSARGDDAVRDTNDDAQLSKL